MALLPRERLGEVVSVNFGDSNRAQPATTDWIVGGGGQEGARGDRKACVGRCEAQRH